MNYNRITNQQQECSQNSFILIKINMIDQKFPLYCNKPQHEGQQIQGLAYRKNNIQVYCHICYKQLQKSEYQSQLLQSEYKFLELASLNNIRQQYIYIIKEVKMSVDNQLRTQKQILKALSNEIENLLQEVEKQKNNTFTYLNEELLNVEYENIQSLQNLGQFIAEKCKYSDFEFNLEKEKIHRQLLNKHQQQLNKSSFLNKLNLLYNEFKQTLDSNYYYYDGTLNYVLETITISDSIIALGSQDGQVLIYKDTLLKQRYNQNRLRIIKMEIDKNSLEPQFIYVLRQNNYNEHILSKYGINENEQYQMDISLYGIYVDFTPHKNYIYYISDGKLFQINNSKIKLDSLNQDINDQILLYETVKSFDTYKLSQLRFLLITDDDRIVYILDSCKNQIQLKIQYENQKKNDIITNCKFIDPFKLLVGGQFNYLLLYKLKKSSLILKNVIPTEFHCLYLSINNELLVYSDGFKFSIKDKLKKVSKLFQGYCTIKTVDSNKQVKSKFWTQLSNGEVEYIIQENDKSKVIRILR
ncbi:hypothetical protein pb186bvf_012213 [Paramecium bursaria]